MRCPEYRGVLVVPAVACPPDPAAPPKSPRLSRALTPIPTVDPFAQPSNLAELDIDEPQDEVWSKPRSKAAESSPVRQRMPSWERQTPSQKIESPVEAEDSGKVSGVLKWLFVVLAFFAVIGGGAGIMTMETSRRQRQAREDFLNQKQNAFSAVESGELTSALAIFSRLTTHPGKAEEDDSVSQMADVLSQMTNPTAVEDRVKKLDDPQLLRLHDQGLFDDALHVHSSLQGKPQDDWIGALRSASRREVSRRHSERKKMLAEIPQKLADELAELHSSQAETLRLTNRLEVEEKQLSDGSMISTRS